MNSDTFLLYDFVHVMKCIRNNWLTEKCGELQYEFDGCIQVARWEHLKMLHNAESNSLVKLSKLNEVSVSPKPIERQKVRFIILNMGLKIAKFKTVKDIKSKSLVHLKYIYCIQESIRKIRNVSREASIFIIQVYMS